MSESCGNEAGDDEGRPSGEPAWTPELSIDELHEALNRAYRFHVPRAFAEAVVATRGIDEYDAFGFNWTFQHGRSFRSLSAGYSTFIPDFFIFGAPGVDGLASGFVTYAPELNAGELPVYEFDPVYGTVSAVAPHFRTALVNFAAWRDGSRTDEERVESEAYAEAARRLGLPAVPVATGPLGVPYPYVPSCPEGWRFVPVKDTIGVLAPADGFGPAIAFERFTASSWDIEARAALLREFTELCEELLQTGYPASVMLGMQTVYRENPGDASLLDLWARAYESLGRVIVADVLRDKIVQIERVRRRR